jgi:hypothetical protein
MIPSPPLRLPASRPRLRAPRAAGILSALLLTSLPLPRPAEAQSGATFLLRVTEAETGRPLEGARVEILRRRLSGVTGPDGWVRIAGVPPGIHAVEVHHLGFVPERLTKDFTRVITVKGQVDLLPRPLELEALEVVAERQNQWLQATGFYERRRSSGGTFLTRTEIVARARGRASVASVLESLPGFSLQSVDRGYTFASRRYSPVGRSGCFTRVFVNGAVVEGGGSGGRGGLMALVSLPELEAIEWYAGPSMLPPQFHAVGPYGGDGSSCGALVLWTRSGA